MIAEYITLIERKGKKQKESNEMECVIIWHTGKNGQTTTFN